MSLQTALPAGRLAVAIVALLGLLASLAPAEELVDSALLKRMGVADTWRKYQDVLSWGKGQSVALLDDGADPAIPQWNVQMPWGPKTLAGYDAVDQDNDPTAVPPGYHGSTIGYPSSLNWQGNRGVAYNDSVINVRAVTVVHLTKDESKSLARALQWVIDHRQKYNITAVNLAPVDDQEHAEPVPTAIDAKLAQLRQLGVWVSAPCANHGYTKGISWPACQPDCFAIGAVKPDADVVHLDRSPKTAILVPAGATSSSNAFIVGCSMVLREAIEKSGFDWRAEGKTLPDAMMAIFTKTGVEVDDPATRLRFKRLNLLAAVDHVFAAKQLGRQVLGANNRSGKWDDLFDGQTLQGWHKNPQRIQHGTGGRWIVEDGTILAEQDPPGSGNGGILLTDKKFGDFELLIDMKPDWGVDTGLFLRCNDKGHCFQVMVDYHDNGNVGQLASITDKGPRDFNTRTFDINGKYDERGNLIALTTAKHKSAQSVGLERSCTPDEWLKAWKLNDWNTARVRVQGQYPRITTWINGLKVCVFDGCTSGNQDYIKEEIFQKLGARGSIALQVYAGQYCPKGSKCRWKNIKIREI